jgi:hypothetical protein
MRIREHAKVREQNGAREIVVQGMCRRDRDRRLADTASTDDREKAR